MFTAGHIPLPQEQIRHELPPLPPLAGRLLGGANNPVNDSRQDKSPTPSDSPPPAIGTATHHLTLQLVDPTPITPPPGN